MLEHFKAALGWLRNLHAVMFFLAVALLLAAYHETEMTVSPIGVKVSHSDLWIGALTILATSFLRVSVVFQLQDIVKSSSKLELAELRKFARHALFLQYMRMRENSWRACPLTILVVLVEFVPIIAVGACLQGAGPIVANFVSMVMVAMTVYETFIMENFVYVRLLGRPFTSD